MRSHLQASKLWSDDRWQAYEYDERHALSASWEGWIAPGSAVGVGTHMAATNASVVSAATSLGAASSVRKRGALGNLEHITQGANDIWEATRSASGHRLTEISDQSTTWTIEHDALGRVTAALDKSYDYDPLGRLVLARDTNDVILESYLMDGNGRVVQVNRHTSDTVYETSVIAYDDATGTLHRVMHYTPEGLSTHYDRYGLRCDEETSLTVTCTETNIPFGFNGMWRSSATALSYMRNRWYSPQLAQFMSHDPLEYIDSYNMYAFAALDPINFWDPWGLDAQELAEDIDGLKETGAKIWNSAKSMAQSVKSSVENFFRSSGTEDSETESPGTNETLDPLDSYNPALQTMKAAYLLFKAEQSARDKYWTGIQNDKFGDLLPPGTEHRCGVSCELGLLGAMVDGIDATGALANAGMKLSIRINLLKGNRRTSSKVGTEADFVVGPDGTTVSTSQSRMREGFDAAGFQSQDVTSRTSGKVVGQKHVLPDGNVVRTMDADGRNLRRASFTNANNGAIDPFTGKPPQPPPGLSRPDRKRYVRERSHILQGR